MSYTPTTWANGDTITAQKMNNIEQGIVAASSGGGGVVVVSGEWDAGETTFTLDKTYNELKALLLSGAVVVLREENDNGVASRFLSQCSLTNGAYYALFMLADFGSGGTFETIAVPYITDSADGYPAFED